MIKNAHSASFEFYDNILQTALRSLGLRFRGDSSRGYSIMADASCCSYICFCLKEQGKVIASHYVQDTEQPADLHNPRLRETLENLRRQYPELVISLDKADSDYPLRVHSTLEFELSSQEDANEKIERVISVFGDVGDRVYEALKRCVYEYAAVTREIAEELGWVLNCRNQYLRIPSPQGMTFVEIIERRPGLIELTWSVEREDTSAFNQLNAETANSLRTKYPQLELECYTTLADDLRDWIVRFTATRRQKVPTDPSLAKEPISQLLQQTVPQICQLEQEVLAILGPESEIDRLV